MKAAGVLIVRDGSVLLAPRGESPHLAGPPPPRVHLGWIGGSALPGETGAECARREAHEEIGCEVELLASRVTYERAGGTVRKSLCDRLLQGDLQPVLVVEAAFFVFRARPLREPRPVDVPALAWVPVTLLPALRTGVPAASLDIVGDVDAEAAAFIGDGSITGALRAVVEEFGADALLDVEPHGLD